MNYGLLLYLKPARVDVGNIRKKGKNIKGIITWSVFARVFFTELCLYMSPISHMKFNLKAHVRAVIQILTVFVSLSQLGLFD